MKNAFRLVEIAAAIATLLMFMEWLLEKLPVQDVVVVVLDVIASILIVKELAKK